MSHAVVKWTKDADRPMIVAGGNGQGDSLRHLYLPGGIVVDRLGNLYIADAFNDRVVCWLKGTKEGHVIVGGHGEGNGSNQLRYPSDLAFDKEGHLYVVDQDNNRVQKFLLDSS